MLLNNNSTSLSVYHVRFSDCPDRRTDYDGSREAWIFQKSWIWKGQFWRQRYNTYICNMHSCKPQCVVQRTIKFGLHCCVCPPDYKRRVMANICMLSTFMRSYSPCHKFMKSYSFPSPVTKILWPSRGCHNLFLHLLFGNTNKHFPSFSPCRFYPYSLATQTNTTTRHSSNSLFLINSLHIYFY